MEATEVYVNSILNSPKISKKSKVKTLSCSENILRWTFKYRRDEFLPMFHQYVDEILFSENQMDECDQFHQLYAFREFISETTHQQNEQHYLIPFLKNVIQEDEDKEVQTIDEILMFDQLYKRISEQLFEKSFTQESEKLKEEWRKFQLFQNYKFLLEHFRDYPEPQQEILRQVCAYSMYNSLDPEDQKVIQTVSTYNGINDPRVLNPLFVNDPVFVRQIIYLYPNILRE